MSVAIVVLAAGGSTRMGRSKQLLELGGVPLVGRAAMAALDAGLGRVVVVVGAEAERVETALAGLDVDVVKNPRWEEGMGTSLAAGVERVERDEGTEAVVIMLADQPTVDAAVLKRLAGAWRREGAEAAACMYGSTRGVPALFSRGLFERLRSLPPDGGAKHVLADGKLRVAAVECPAAGLPDIDTPEDFRRFMEGS